jgi:hypothetical protein
LWLRNHYPGEATVVVTEVPGFWFRLFSGKNVTAATNPIIERNAISESVLALSYELEHPQSLVRAFEAKGDFSDDTSVSINGVWNRISYSSAGGDFLSYIENGVEKRTRLLNFTRETGFEVSSPPRLVIRYINEDLSITKTISFQNDRYPINVNWTLSTTKNGISNVVLYVSIFFDLRFSFQKALVPGMLTWENPWDKPSSFEEGNWSTVDFSPSTLTDNYIGLYDEKNGATFALKFDEIPDWGNVGALASRQIDAIRFNHTLSTLSIGKETSFGYQVLTFSKSSNPAVQMPTDVKSLLAAKAPEPFEVMSRDYRDYIRQNNIQFIVYDKNQLDTKMVHSKLLELIYSNNRYVIFKIKGS